MPLSPSQIYKHSYFNFDHSNDIFKLLESVEPWFFNMQIVFEVNNIIYSRTLC